MSIPRRTYDIEGRFVDGPWMIDERLHGVTRKEAEEALGFYEQENPSMRFRLVVVKRATSTVAGGPK